MKEKNIRELAKRMGLITVEDMCQYTIAQLVVKIANKVNELVDEVWRFETDVQEMLKTQNENIQYLLGEGLHLEVGNIFDVWVQDGTFDTLINHSALKKVNERIDETNAQLSKVNESIDETNAQLSEVMYLATNDNIQSILDLDKPKRIKVIDKITKTITITTNNTTIVGDGSLILDGASVDVNSGLTNVTFENFKGINSPFNFKGNHENDALISDVKIDRVHLTFTNTTLIAIGLTDVNNATLTNVTISRPTGGGRALSISRGQNITIDNFKAHGNLSFGVNIYMANAARLNKNITLKNVDIYRNECYEVQNGEQGLYAHGFDGLYLDNVEIRGFFTSGTLNQDFKIRNAKNAIINNCRGGQMLIVDYSNSDPLQGLESVTISNSYTDRLLLWEDTGSFNNIYVNNVYGHLLCNDAPCVISGYIKSVFTQKPNSKIINAYIDDDVNSDGTSACGFFIKNTVVNGSVYAYNVSDNKIFDTLITSKNEVANSIKIDGTSANSHTNNVIMNVDCNKSIYINSYGTRKPKTMIINSNYGGLDTALGSKEVITIVGSRTTSDFISSEVNAKTLVLTSGGGVTHTFAVTDDGVLQKM